MTSSLRSWQRECIDIALMHYTTMPHFFCQAIPGAGKTRMAAELARCLIDQNKVDLVLCFAPSRQVVESIRLTFSQVLGRQLDGLIGSIGTVYTYQAMAHRTEAFWTLLDSYRVLVIFDEIHHCSGSDYCHGNAWGQLILRRIHDRAAFTLALSGTPWRSDDQAIALARYASNDGNLICDYRYGLREAISDGVCRSPRVVLVDNEKVKLEAGEHVHLTRHFRSIGNLLCESPVTYDNLLRHDEIVRQLISVACERLDALRVAKTDAAGLMVATDIAHAHQIAKALEAKGEEYEVVTTQTPDAQRAINAFKHGNGRWIVAVGMISEGTDIPRLQVCCYLSRIRTELHYRQVLGRVLRRTDEHDGEGWLYMLAEPTLGGYAERLSEDLPNDHAVMTTLHTTSDASDGRRFDGIVPSIQNNESSGTLRLDVSGSLPIRSTVVTASASDYLVTFSQDFKQMLLKCL